MYDIVRMCARIPPFFSAARYKPPLFLKKESIMNVPFSEFGHLNGQTFSEFHVYAHIFAYRFYKIYRPRFVFGQKVSTRTLPNLVSGQAQFQRVCFDRILYSNTANSRPKCQSFVPHRRHCVVSLSKTH